MTLFPLMECCELLAIDPKTLRHWLEQATMSVHVHPTDRRRKCLTYEQVQQLAVFHDCVLSPDETRPTPPLVKILSQKASQEHLSLEMIHPLALETMLPTPLLEPVDLIQKLSGLEAKVATLQELLAHLTLELVQERRLRTEGSSQAFLQPLREQDGGHPAFQAMQKEAQLDETRRQGRDLHPAEIQASFSQILQSGLTGWRGFLRFVLWASRVTLLPIAKARSGNHRVPGLPSFTSISTITDLILA